MYAPHYNPEQAVAATHPSRAKFWAEKRAQEALGAAKAGWYRQHYNEQYGSW